MRERVSLADQGWHQVAEDGTDIPPEMRSDRRARMSLRLRDAAAVSGRWFQAFGKGILGLALPPTCAACGCVMGDDGGLCPNCWQKLRFITPPVCERTGMPLPTRGNGVAMPVFSALALAEPPAFERARSVVLFNDVARLLVHGLKYSDRLELARPMARLMAQAGRQLLDEADMLVPVPLHPLRLWRRRFNQSALLVRHIHAVRAQMGPASPVRMDILLRRRRTISQTNLDRAQRRDNVAGAFAVSRVGEMDVRGRNVLLVDDVYTTGATLDACARTLLRAGAGRVNVLTFARVEDRPGDETDMTDVS